MSQQWSAQNYARDGAFVPALGAAVADLLAPLPGERVLDLGCGDGTLTLELVRRGADVVGVDSSPELVAVARSRGVDARLLDARTLPFEAEFNAVFSNAALHWMNDQDAVLAGVRRALKKTPGARFVAEFGGHGNVAAICTALLAALQARGGPPEERLPWYFPTVDEYAAKLAQHGFAVERIELFPRPTPLPTGMRSWLDTFANPFFGGLDGAARSTILDEVVGLLAPSLRDREGRWTADYVRLRFAAFRAE